MKHWTTYPLIAHPYNPEFVSGEGLARFARAAEAAGFDGIAFTDHPAPSDKWLNAGGHDRSTRSPRSPTSLRSPSGSA